MSMENRDLIGEPQNGRSPEIISYAQINSLNSFSTTRLSASCETNYEGNSSKRHCEEESGESRVEDTNGSPHKLVKVKQEEPPSMKFEIEDMFHHPFSIRNNLNIMQVNNFSVQTVHSLFKGCRSRGQFLTARLDNNVIESTYFRNSQIFLHMRPLYGNKVGMINGNLSLLPDNDPNEVEYFVIDQGQVEGNNEFERRSLLAAAIAVKNIIPETYRSIRVEDNIVHFMDAEGHRGNYIDNIMKSIMFLCPHCPKLEFVPNKHNRFLKHLYYNHGITSSGNSIPQPVSEGYFLRETSDKGKKELKPAVICPNCGEAILIKSSDDYGRPETFSDIKEYLDHYSNVHIHADN